MSTVTKFGRAMEIVAEGLRLFGYPDTTAEMMRDVWVEYEKGKRYPDLPHGIIGAFAESQFDQVDEELRNLAAWERAP